MAGRGEDSRDRSPVRREAHGPHEPLGDASIRVRTWLRLPTTGLGPGGRTATHGAKALRGWTLESTVEVPAPIEEVFAFVAAPQNLDRVTPPWFRLQLRSRLPERLSVGTLVDYRLQIHRIPFHWQSVITAWEPPHRIEYRQKSGPYRSFIHDHRLTEVPGGTRVLDVVRYTVPGGAAVNRLYVQGALERVFRYRGRSLATLGGDSETGS